MIKTGITGATGQLGRAIVEKLKERIPSEAIVALVRSPERASGLGVEVREFDYDKPEFLPPALEGIDNLILISGNIVGQRARQHANVINSAKGSGVKWIVYTSLLRADSTSLSLAGEHLDTEKALKQSGIPFTILRNGWYTENYTSSIGGVLKNNALYGCAGKGKISSAARADYADAAVAVITGQGHEGKTYELAGDNSYTLADLASEISRQTGRDIPYRNLDEIEYVSVLTGQGVPEGFANAIAGWDVSASKGDLFDDNRVLSQLIKRPTTTLADSVKEVLSRLGY